MDRTDRTDRTDRLVLGARALIDWHLAMKYTEEQRAAIETLSPRICVDAGAGSGKTRVLVDRVVDLIANEQAGLDEIVGITFTEKAASEMKARLRRTFREKAPDTDPETMSRWRGLERRVEFARISTIHAFCAGLLRENALSLRLDPDFAVLAEDDAVLLKSDALGAELHRLLDAGDAPTMRLATEMGLSGLQRVLDGMLARRGVIEGLARQGYPLDAPAALAARWKQDAEAEGLHLVRQAAGGHEAAGYAEALQGFDGCCGKAADGREIRRQRILAGLAALPRAETFAEAQRILATMLGTPKERGSKKNWDPEESFAEITAIQESVKKAFERFRWESAGAALEAKAAGMACDLVHCHSMLQNAFEEAKRKGPWLDFDDLIAQALAALDHPEVLKRTAAGIRFLLVDEFQDTDETQLALVRRICDAPGGPALFIVGDAKQSIYRFRGAEVQGFQQERERATAVLPLAKNFRSLPNVLAFVDHFFAKSGLLHAVEPEYRAMATHREPAEDSRIEFVVPEREVGENEKWRAGDSRRAEAELIARRIVSACEGENPVAVFDEARADWRPANYGDVALLFRSMSHVHVFEAALRRWNVPYQMISGRGFYARQEIADVSNLLKTAADPWDEEALFAFLRSPMAALSDESLFWLCRERGLAEAFNADSVPEPLRDSEQAERLALARERLAAFRAQRAMPLTAFMRMLLAETGYEAILLSDPYLGLQKASNVRKLVKLADAFGRSRPPTLRRFIAYLDAVGSEGVREAEAPLQPEGAGAVTLLTVHKSKGLEFPIVVIPEMGQRQQGSGPPPLCLHPQLGLAPRVLDPKGKSTLPLLGKAIEARIKQEETDEQARLLYVAMTRARDLLILCGNPEVNSGSWLEPLNEVYGVVDAEDGAERSGTGWEAVVLRAVKAPPRKSAAKAGKGAIGLAQLAQQAAPLPAAAATHRAYAISTILDYMAGGFDAEEEGEQRHEEDAPRSVRMGRAAARGTLVHRMFEVWPFPGDGPPIERLVAEAGLGPSQSAGLCGDLESVAARFRESALYTRMADAPGLEREAPFILRLPGGMLTGTIDALLGDGTVVDFKTGRHDKDRHARYEWQLLLYAGALRQLRGIQPKEGLLYYVDEDQIHTLAIDTDQIDAALRHADEVLHDMSAAAPKEK